jgi:F-type H+-transporting ATPase subunit a
MRKTLLALGMLLVPAAASASAGAFSWTSLAVPDPALQPMVTAVGIGVLLVAWSAVAVKSKKTEDMVIPDGRFTLRNLMELIFEFLVRIGEDIMGHKAIKYIPLLGSCFVFILFMNLLGLVPGFLPPTDKMNITVGLAMVIFFSTHVFGVMENGIGYFKHFLGPVWWMAPIMLPIEIISHLARPMSLSLRLFGNISGDHAVVLGFMSLVPFVVPTIFMGLGVFVSFMQAFIFTVLSMIYIAGAIAHEEEH